MIPGSALRKLSAITGLQATKEGPNLYKLEISPGVALFSFLADEKEACAQLRQANWQRVCRNVFTRQGWKCNRCGGMNPLQGHHKIYRARWKRSDGPLDVESNVEGLDSACHQQIHNE